MTFWIDQDAARQGLIKGYSGSEHSAEIIDVALRMLSDIGVFHWFARVPSPSNPADWPSRLMWDELVAAYPAMRRVRVPRAAWDTIRYWGK